MLVPSGVHYRGVSLYEMHAGGKWETISQLEWPNCSYKILDVEWDDIPV